MCPYGKPPGTARTTGTARETKRRSSAPNANTQSHQPDKAVSEGNDGKDEQWNLKQG
jgi:hypothetical protein